MLLRQFPSLQSLVLGGRPPLVVNAYPAPLPLLPMAIGVDAYCRPETVRRAFLLAASEQLPCILVAMPLFAAELLTVQLSRGEPLPNPLLLALGGHACPQSLEGFLRSQFAAAAIRGGLVHLYGVAEIDAGLMAAVERSPEGLPLFRSIDERFTPVVIDGQLSFKNAADPSGGPVPTGDLAEERPGGILVGNPARLSGDVAAELDGWGMAEWSRRTGFLGMDGGHMVRQLRRGHTASGAGESPFDAFCERHPMSWLNKPDWGAGGPGDSCTPGG